MTRQKVHGERLQIPAFPAAQSMGAVPNAGLWNDYKAEALHENPYCALYLPAFVSIPQLLYNIHKTIEINAI